MYDTQLLRSLKPFCLSRTEILWMSLYLSPSWCLFTVFYVTNSYILISTLISTHLLRCTLLLLSWLKQIMFTVFYECLIFFKIYSVLIRSTYSPISFFLREVLFYCNTHVSIPTPVPFNDNETMTTSIYSLSHTVLYFLLYVRLKINTSQNRDRFSKTVPSIIY